MSTSTVHKIRNGTIARPGRDARAPMLLNCLSLVVNKGHDKGIYRTLNKGLKSAEHKAFVKKLAKS